MKKKTNRSDAYLDFIRSNPCAGICTFPEHMTNGPNFTGIEAAHVRIGGGGGVGLKPSDFYAVPLCHNCHERQHRIGERSFWIVVGVEPEIVITRQLIAYTSIYGNVWVAIRALEEICAEL